MYVGLFTELLPDNTLKKSVTIYLTSFVKIGTSVGAILWFYPRNLNGCTIGITDGRDV
jgi:hypothetical protein